MKSRVGLFVLLVIAFVLVGCSAAAQPAAKAGSIEVVSPWVRVAAGGDNTAAYMTLKNTAGEADQLVKAEFTQAGMVELMNTTMQDSKMSMFNVDTIEIPANGEVVLKPGGYHVMLMMLKSDLKDGDKAQVTLTFEKGGSVTIDMPVMMQPAE